MVSFQKSDLGINKEAWLTQDTRKDKRAWPQLSLADKLLRMMAFILCKFGWHMEPNSVSQKCRRLNILLLSGILVTQEYFMLIRFFYHFLSITFVPSFGLCSIYLRSMYSIHIWHVSQVSGSTNKNLIIRSLIFNVENKGRYSPPLFFLSACILRKF